MKPTRTILLLFSTIVLYSHVQAQVVQKIEGWLHSEMRRIDSTLLDAALSGRIKAWWNDSFATAYHLEHLKDRAALVLPEEERKDSGKLNLQKLLNSGRIDGFSFCYRSDINLLGPRISRTIIGIGVNFRPIFQGLLMPNTTLFWFRSEDITKLLSPKQTSILNLIGNSSYATAEIVNSSEVMDQIHSNISTGRSKFTADTSYLNRIHCLSFEIFRTIVSVFERKYNSSKAGNTGFYTDKDLSKPLTRKALDEYLMITYNVRDQDGKEFEVLERVDFLLFHEMLIQSPKSIGISLDKEYSKRSLYISREEFNTMSPLWLLFVLSEIK